MGGAWSSLLGHTCLSCIKYKSCEARGNLGGFSRAWMGTRATSVSPGALLGSSNQSYAFPRHQEDTLSPLCSFGRTKTPCISRCSHTSSMGNQQPPRNGNNQLWSSRDSGGKGRWEALLPFLALYLCFLHSFAMPQFLNQDLQGSWHPAAPTPTLTNPVRRRAWQEDWEILSSAEVTAQPIFYPKTSNGETGELHWNKLTCYSQACRYPDSDGDKQRASTRGRL